MENKKSELKEITELVEGEEDFRDIGLKITEKRKQGDKLIFIGQGLFEGDIVGLKFETLTNFQAGLLPEGELDSKNGFTSKSVKVTSLGRQSDNFVKALSSLYELPTSKGFTKKLVIASTFSLNQDDANLNNGNGHHKFKLFFSAYSEEDYCEIFFNLNFDKGTIELLEKDLECRANLLKLFTN